MAVPTISKSDSSSTTIEPPSYTRIKCDKGSELEQLCQKLLETVQTVRNFLLTRKAFNSLEDAPVFFSQEADEGGKAVFSLHELTCFNSERFASNAESFPTNVAHEYTHAFLNKLRDLPDTRSDGAILESLAQVVSLMYQRHVLKQNSWKIGRYNFSQPQGALKPTEIEYEDDDKNKLSINDGGNVHHNGRVLTYAFCLAAQNIDLGKENTLLETWLNAVRSFDSFEEDEGQDIFQSFAIKTIECAEDQRMRQAIENAWQQVGIQPTEEEEDDTLSPPSNPSTFFSPNTPKGSTHPTLKWLLIAAAVAAAYCVYRFFIKDNVKLFLKKP